MKQQTLEFRDNTIKVIVVKPQVKSKTRNNGLNKVITEDETTKKNHTRSQDKEYNKMQ